MSAMSIQELATLAESFTQSDGTEELLNSISQQVAANAAGKLGDAMQSIRDAGEDPSDYIPKSRSAIRNKQAEVRIQAEQARAAQELKHREEMHQLEMDLKRRQVDDIMSNSKSE